MQARVLVLLSVGAACASTPALAADLESTCGVYAPNPAQALQEMQVSAQGRTHFLLREAGKRSSTYSELRAYLTHGDHVLASGAVGELTCVWFGSISHQTAGWIKSKDLSPTNNRDLKPRDWNGRWREAGAQLDLSSSGAKIALSGDAVGGQPAYNSALADGVGRLERGDRLTINSRTDTGDCVLHLHAFPDYLVVADENQCGGAGVGFNGLYVRSSKELAF